LNDKKTGKIDGKGIRIFMGGVGYSKKGKVVVPLHEVKTYPGGRTKQPKRKAG
jgi:hypothetical protein